MTVQNGGGCGSTDEDQRVRTLGAAALDLVDQTINHPGLFEGSCVCYFSFCFLLRF